MRFLLLPLVILPLAACATMDAPVTQAGRCDNGPLAAFVGRTADQATGAEMLRASGARTLRWGPPGGAMTMDYREDRLTVSYDEKQVITRASCG